MDLWLTSSSPSPMRHWNASCCASWTFVTRGGEELLLLLLLLLVSWKSISIKSGNSHRQYLFSVLMEPPAPCTT